MNDEMQTSRNEFHAFELSRTIPAILVAYAPFDSVIVDYCKLTPSFKIGRSEKCDLEIRDIKLSKSHVHITRDKDFIWWIDDLNSTNGTSVNGIPVFTKQLLKSPSVIRAGHSILVFHKDARDMLLPLVDERFNIAGRFHVMSLIEELRKASISKRHVLLAGPTGSGKELAAHAMASMVKKPLIVHNAARYSTEDEAAATLFGVAPKVFTNVEAREGLIDQAHNGILFLDEIHNLPERVQRSLLRVMEDRMSAKIGQTSPHEVDVRFILASNAPEPTYSLSIDLLARLRVVNIPPLNDRIADIPSIFDHLLRSTLKQYDMEELSIMDILDGDHYEALCLDGFEMDNVRGLVDLTDKIVTAIKAGAKPDLAVAQVFAERVEDKSLAKRGDVFHVRADDDDFDTKVQRAMDTYPNMNKSISSDPEYSEYNKNKNLIIDVFHKCHGNIAATARCLQAEGIRCSERWLSEYLDRWGIRPKKNKKKNSIK